MTRKRWISPRSCSVEDCERPTWGKGLCNTHYQRWVKTGSLDLPEYPPKPCAVPNCENTISGRAKTVVYCPMHETRFRKYGDAHTVLTGLPPRKPVVGYPRAHQRVYTDRGKATEHDCATCGHPAEQWAYDHNDPNELVSDQAGYRGLRYSVDSSYYVPMCRICHRAFDGHGGGRDRYGCGHARTEQNTYEYEGDGSRRCLTCIRSRRSPVAA